METLFSYICEHAHNAHWIMFGLLLLAGLNLPISEDLMLLFGGAIASRCIPDQTVHLYLWIFAGCYISAWEAYWIGRLLGPRLYTIRPFRYIITQERMETLRYYYAKFGVFTFIAGRFCPGGIRNALFMSSGLTKMPFGLFLLRDGFACLLSSITIFTLGYHFGENIDTVARTFEHYSHWFLAFFGIVVTLILIRMWIKHPKKVVD